MKLATESRLYLEHWDLCWKFCSRDLLGWVLSRYIIGHNCLIKRDKLFNIQEIIRVMCQRRLMNAPRTRNQFQNHLLIAVNQRLCGHEINKESKLVSTLVVGIVAIWLNKIAKFLTIELNCTPGSICLLLSEGMKSCEASFKEDRFDDFARMQCAVSLQNHYNFFILIKS